MKNYIISATNFDIHYWPSSRRRRHASLDILQTMNGLVIRNVQSEIVDIYNKSAAKSVSDHNIFFCVVLWQSGILPVRCLPFTLIESDQIKPRSAHRHGGCSALLTKYYMVTNTWLRNMLSATGGT